MSYVLLLALAMLAPSQSAPAGKVDLGESVTYGFAGLKIAMPTGFDKQQAGATNVIRVVKTKNDLPIMSVSLSAFLEKGDMTLDEFVKLVQPNRDDLSVRSFKQLANTSIKLCNTTLNGKVLLVSYDYRSVPTTALMIYVLRPIDEHTQLGYLLVGEADKEHAKLIYDTTCAVANSLQLVDVVHPGKEPLPELLQPIESRANGYSIKIPDTWKVTINRERNQLVMYQLNYLRGGQAMPSIQFSVQTETNTAEIAAKALLRNMEENLTKTNQQYQVVRQSPVKMAGVEGFEFLLRQEVSAREGGGTVMLLLRLVCLNGRSYSIMLLNNIDDPDQMTATVDKVANTLELSTPVTSMPTSLPGYGSEATSRPSADSARSSAEPATEKAK